MISWDVILAQIAMVLAVIGFGWGLRRVGILGAEVIRPLCRLVLDFTLPALILVRMVESVTAAELRAAWHWPLLGAGMVAFSQIVCALCVPRGVKDHRPTLIFCAFLPNWLYLALAVLEPVLGIEATRILLLFNFGVHVWVWTAGVWLFNEKMSFVKGLSDVFFSPPLLATVLGVLAVLFFPNLSAYTNAPAEGIAHLPWIKQVTVIIWGALSMVAAITIPLSLLTVGAQLAGAALKGGGGWSGTIWGTTLRLVIAPALTLLVMAVAHQLGWRPTHTFFIVMFLTAAMPTAVVTGQVAEIYRGDAGLASRLTLLTTLLSLGTVPLWSFVVERVWLFSEGQRFFG